MLELLTGAAKAESGATGRIINVPALNPKRTYQFFPAQTLISADGQRAAFCAPYDTQALASIYTFKTQNGLMVQESVMTDSSTAANSGNLKTFASNSDCTFFVSGGASYNNDGNQGFVMTYTLNGDGSWSKFRTVSPSPVNNGYFGNSVALSPDGTYMAVLAPGENSNNGRIHTFTYLGSSWTAFNRIDLSGTVGSANIIQISRNLSTMVVGVPSQNRIGVFRGYPDWHLVGWLTMPNVVAGSNFGSAVEVSDDGTVILVGAPTQTNGGSNYTGGIYVYVFDGIDVFEHKATILPPSDVGEIRYFGGGIRMSADKSYMLIAAYVSGATTGYLLRYDFNPDWTATRKWTQVRGRPDAYRALSLARTTDNWFIGDFVNHEVLYGT